MSETLPVGPSYAELAQNIMESPPEYFGPAHFSMLSLMIKHNVSLDDVVETANALIKNEDPDRGTKRSLNNIAKREIEAHIKSLIN